MKPSRRVAMQARCFGLRACRLLPEAGGGLQFEGYIVRKPEMNIHFKRAGIHVFHDGDQVPGHGLDLAQSTGLGGTRDARDTNVPVPSIKIRIYPVDP